mgnify:CR=1 FL=1
MAEKDKWDTDPDADCYKNSKDFDVGQYGSEWKSIRNNLTWCSYTYWQFKPFTGRYISVNGDGNRNTTNLRGKPNMRIVILGGSTVWGVGVKDSDTLPSLLSAMLHKTGIVAEVTNLGQIGYMTTQDVICLIEYMKKNPLPGYAIFYNGMNDVLAAVENNRPCVPYNEINREKEFNLLTRRGDLIKSFYYSVFPAKTKNKMQQPDFLIDGALKNYCGNIALIEAIKNKYNFKPLYYLQPTIFHKKYLSKYERQQQQYLKEVKPHIEQFYERIANETALTDIPNFKDISHVLYEIAIPCFVDCAHLSAEANEIIASEMFVDIMAEINAPVLN